MKRFKKAYVEITNVCNLNCSFCPKTKRIAHFMTEQEFLHIVQQIKPFTDYIYLHLMGEPFLHPLLQTFLKIAWDYELKVNLTSNGILICNVEQLLLHAPALRKVGFSLHCFEANKQNQTLKEYLMPIFRFAKNACTKGILCEFRLWNLGGKEERNDEIIDEIQTFFQIDFKEDLINKSSVKIADCLYLVSAEKFEWPDMNRKYMGEKIFCHGLRDQFGILANGIVVPCCLDSEGSIPLGNIFTENLTDILKTERAQNIYQGFSNRKAVEPLCCRCEYAKRF